MKKLRLVVALLIASEFFFCVQGLSAQPGTPEQPRTQDQSAAGPTFNLRIGHANAPLPNSALHVTATVLKDLLEKYSNGRIKAEIYPSAQLGNDAEMADLTVSGALDIWVTSLNLVTNYAPRMNALILPYMFENHENFRNARDSLWTYFNDYLVKRANMRFLTIWDSGYRHVMSTKPVRTLDDLRNLKFRVPPSTVMIAMAKSWGVSPVQVEWSEVFNGLQLGVVDAIEVDDSVLISARMNQVVKYITNDDHILQVSVAVMSENTYNKLPADLKAVVDRASNDSMPLVDARSAGILDEAKQDSLAKGVQYLGRPTDYAQWAQRARSTWPGFYKEIGDGDPALGKEVVDKVFASAGM